MTDGTWLGIVTGLTAEARIARPLGRVAVGGGLPAGAEAAAELLVAQGARALLSFGLCGGLDPALPAGALAVPDRVVEVWFEGDSPMEAWERAKCPEAAPIPPSSSAKAEEPRLSFGGTRGVGARPSPSMTGASAPACPGTIVSHTDSKLRAALTAPPDIDGALCATPAILATAAEKSALHRATRAVAVDLESGAVARVAARHGLPFAVLRAVCDPAGRDLPPAALAALNQHGAIGLLRVLRSVVANPSQIPALLQLARDAAAARRALVGRVGDLVRRGGLVVP